MKGADVKVRETVRYASAKAREKVRRLHEANRIKNINAGGRRVRRVLGDT